MKSIGTLVSELEANISELKCIKADLISKLKEQDKMLIDIEHYIELEILTLGDMRKLCRKQKIILIERRHIKNSLELFQGLGEIINKKNLTKNFHSMLKGQSNKQYTPRAITLEEALA